MCSLINTEKKTDHRGNKMKTKLSKYLAAAIMALSLTACSSGSDAEGTELAQTSLKGVGTAYIVTDDALERIFDIEYRTDADRRKAYYRVNAINYQSRRLRVLLEEESVMSIIEPSDYRLAEIAVELMTAVLDIRDHLDSYYPDLDPETQAVLSVYYKKGVAVYAAYNRAIQRHDRLAAALQVVLLAQQIACTKF